jgi:hypothetical protein
MAVRCFWPPERVMPRSPTMVSKPLGKSRISVAMWAIVAASMTCDSVAVGTPKAMFWRMVSEKRKVSWGTKPMLPRTCARVKLRMGWLSIRTEPGAASSMRGMRLTSVDLPEPVGPTMARLEPAGMRRLMF